MKKIRMLLFVSITVCNMIIGQETVQYHLKPITITASRLNHYHISETREIRILDAETIKSLPIESVSDLMRYGGGIDMHTRGIQVQTDFGLRGSTFEQVLILLDGIRINDPQSGHHNSDIPITVDEIDRIEIMPGHGSSIYGPDGFGGVIQIVTKVPVKQQTRIELHGGHFHTLGGKLSQTYRFGSFAGQLSIGKEKSDGYRLNTDFDQTQFSQRFTFTNDPLQISGSLRYGHKNFGANNFYGNPYSREKTETTMGDIGIRWCVNPILDIDTDVWFKVHDDDFIWDSQKKDQYRNDHRTSVIGLEFQGNMRLHQTVEVVTGFDGIYDEWQLKGLRNGQWVVNNRVWQYRNGLFMEWLWHIQRKWLVDMAMRMDFHRVWGQEFNPSVSLSYKPSPTITLSGSVGRVFRAPTFTDLYYESPTDKGNVTLKPESGWSWEWGFSLLKQRYQTKWTLFFRNEKNGIDWIKRNIDDPWNAVNISAANVAGFSFSGECTFFAHLRLRNHYTYLEKRKRTPVYLSKYLFNYPKHQLTMITIMDWPWGINQSLCLNFFKKEGINNVWLLDCKIMKYWNSWSIYFGIKNILNYKYEEIPGIPMPGRRIHVGSSVVL